LTLCVCEDGKYCDLKPTACDKFLLINLLSNRMSLSIPQSSPRVLVDLPQRERVFAWHVHGSQGKSLNPLHREIIAPHAMPIRVASGAVLIGRLAGCARQLDTGLPQRIGIFCRKSNSPTARPYAVC
jgi:hypothetical protein